jgi:signal transduction histidine kinase
MKTTSFETSSSRPQSRLTLRFAAAVLITMGLALTIFQVIMQPDSRELLLMVLFLSVTSGITLISGYLAYRSGWINRAPSLRASLLATYLIGAALSFLNIWLTARLMFVSQHDLILGTILLLFASGIAVALGAYFSEALTARIRRLRLAVREVREQGLGSRAQVEGRDEIAQLSDDFNAMAAQLQAAEEAQREVERLRKDLIVWVGHDLQTPLTSIGAILQALADGMVEDPETMQRYLGTALREVQSLSVLIDDLFEVARLDAGGLALDLASNSLSDLISDTLESYSRLAEENSVQLSGDVEADVDPVVMDARRIGRVLGNLVGNALRHTPTGGRARVTARRVLGAVEVEVVDSGEGVSALDLPRLFESFYRGEKSRSRATGGAGLGLAIAKGFIEAHGGSIGAELPVEGGARFAFTIPDARNMAGL